MEQRETLCGPREACEAALGAGQDQRGVGRKRSNPPSSFPPDRGAIFLEPAAKLISKARDQRIPARGGGEESLDGAAKSRSQLRRTDCGTAPAWVSVPRGTHGPQPGTSSRGSLITQRTSGAAAAHPAPGTLFLSKTPILIPKAES